jgi:hypothetical protein
VTRYGYDNKIAAIKLRQWENTMWRLALALGTILCLTFTPNLGKLHAEPIAVPPATCGAGSSPETGLQGQVPLADRQSGRSQQGYRCNLVLVGQYQGLGTSWVNPVYDKCVYLSSAFPSNLTSPTPGVSVIDVSNPAQPVRSAVLASPAMTGGTWESLKVDPTRKLLGAVAGGPAVGVAFFDVYDISQNCRSPRLLNGLLGTPITLPANVLGHEGGWSPDGKTYWGAGLVGGVLTAIDVSVPALPHIVFTGSTGLTNHGFSLSADGNRMYMSTAIPAGMQILDTSDVQRRKLFPALRTISQISWTDGFNTQQTLPVTYGTHRYVLAVDEADSGGIRFIDITNEAAPAIVSSIRLAINLPSAMAQRRADAAGNGLFDYESHYCTVDKVQDPTALACGWIQSGIRVFDIRNPLAPKEIAYFNPPAQVGKVETLLNSEHANGLTGHSPAVVTGSQNGYNVDLGTVSEAVTSLVDYGTAPTMTADWCSSPPSFVGTQLWVACQDNGFMVLQFTNNVYPVH